MSGGAQYRPNQAIDLFAYPVPADGPATPPPLTDWSTLVNTLPANYKSGVVTTAKGTIPATDLGNLPAGKYWIIADYNRDSIFNGEWDASTVITVEPGPAAPKGVMGRVGSDADGDGFRESADGDGGLAFRTVTLLDAAGDVANTALTDAEGFYHFIVDTAAVYTVRVDLPSGYTFSPTNAIDDDGVAHPDDDSDVDSSGHFAVAAGSGDVTVDASLILSSPAVVRGSAWTDANANGVRDTSDDAYAGIPVALLDMAGDTVADGVTLADGSYSFGGLVPGEYSLVVLPPSGTLLSTGPSSKSVSATAGVVTTSDIGVYTPGSISGLVWDDTNRDGIRQDTEVSFLGGIAVDLYDASGEFIDATTTESDGSYAFDDLTPGDYSLYFELPTGKRYSLQHQGTLTARDSDPDDEFGVADFTLASGETLADLDAGYVPNRPPTAVDDAVAVSEGSTYSGTVLGNDSDPDGDPLDVSLVSGPAHGSFALDPEGTFTYTPGSTYHRTDSFVYQVDDGFGGTATATVTLTVGPDTSGGDDSYTVHQGKTIDVLAPVGLLANDPKPGGYALTVTGYTQPINLATGADVSGDTLTVLSGGRMQYRPAAGFVGIVRFEYTVSNGHGYTATHAVYIDVQNVAPVGVNNSYTVSAGGVLQVTIASAGVLGNDTDADADKLYAVLLSTTTKGTLYLNSNGTFTYRPNAGQTGIDTFQYRAFDGAQYSDPITVTLTIA